LWPKALGFTIRTIGRAPVDDDNKLLSKYKRRVYVGAGHSTGPL